MRKSTKNKITKVIHAILIIFTVFLALLTSVYAVLRDVGVQSLIARSAAGFASEALNTEVKVKSFFITPDLEVHLDGVQINDLEQYPMFKIGEFKVKLSFNLIRNGLRFSEVYLKDAYGNITTYEGNEKSNVAELFSSNSEKKEKNDQPQSKAVIKVDKINIINAHFIMWDQNNDQPELKSMDYKHMDIDSINLLVRNFEYKICGNDTISCNIKKLSAKERCGIDLKLLSTNVLFCPTDIILGNSIIDLNNSHLDFNLEFKYNGFDDFGSFVDSIELVANLRNTHLLLSDIKYFASIMEKMPDDITISTDFRGIINDFEVSNLDLSFGECTNIKGNLAMKGIAAKNFEKSYWIIDFPKLTTSYNDLVNFYIPSSQPTIPLPEKLEPLGNVSLSIDYKGTPVNFDCNLDAKTNIGDVNASVYLNREDKSAPCYNATVVANNINFQSFIKTDDDAKVTLAANINGQGFNINSADMNGLIRVKSLEIKQNTFENFNIEVSAKNKIASVNTLIINPNVGLYLDASADMKNEKPVFKAFAHVEDLDFVGLKLVNDNDDDNDNGEGKHKTMKLSTDINAQCVGTDINTLQAKVRLDNTRYVNGDNTLNMKHLDGSLSEQHGIKSANVNCDFFELQADGMLEYNAIVDAIKYSLSQYIDIQLFKAKNSNINDIKQEFALSLLLKNTEQLTKMFMPNMHIAPNTSLSITYTNGMAPSGQTFDCPKLKIGGITVNNIDIRNNMFTDRFVSNISVENVIIKDSTEKSPHRFAFEDVKITTDIANDTINCAFSSDDHKQIEHNLIDIKAQFAPYEDGGGLVKITSGDIILNDTLLKINPLCKIDFRGDKTYVDNFGFKTKLQSLTVNGSLPYKMSDTLWVSMKDFDMSDLDFFMRNSNVYFSGSINGDASVSGMKEQLWFTSNLEIDEMTINDEAFGDVSVLAFYDDKTQSITMKTSVFKPGDEAHTDKSFDFGGDFTPNSTDELDFKLNVNDFKLNTLEPFVKAISGRLDGAIDGDITLKGTLSEPVLDGNLVMNNAGIKINFLNTYFKINDTINFSRNSIDFSKLTLIDTTGNKMIAQGAITHNYLKDFYLDIKLNCHNFAAMNIPAENAKGFYGSAVADGVVTVTGPFDNIKLNIDVETEKGTEINIPITSSTSVDDNFITFTQIKTEEDTIVEEEVAPIVQSGGFELYLNASVNPNTHLNVFLPSKMGKIHAVGTGNVSLAMAKGELGLNGIYTISSGDFLFTLQVVTRNFTIRRGSKIAFNGNATEADLDVVASYRTKANLCALNSSIDSSAYKNANVDCILHLKNKMTNPTITFGLEFPNIDDYNKSLIYSSLDTTNQNVMAQHVLSLMVLGIFANTNNTNIVQIGSAASYNVITGQLNSWLSQLSKDFNIGVNYKPNSSMSNEEIDVALSTQLFDDRLTIEGNFGVIRNNSSASAASSKANDIVGDVDITFRLTKILNLLAYNHTNINKNNSWSAIESLSDYTQGLGISLSQSFDKISEIFQKPKNNNSTKKQKKEKKKKNNNNDEK